MHVKLMTVGGCLILAATACSQGVTCPCEGSLIRDSMGKRWLISLRYGTTRETDRQYRLSLEHQVNANWSAGFDYLPKAKQISPRVVGQFPLSPTWSAETGLLDTRTSTFEGGLGLVGQFTWKGIRRFDLSAGLFQEFRGELDPVATAAFRLYEGLKSQVSYDGQFFHAGFSWNDGERTWAFTRTGTNHFSFSVAFGF